MENDKTKLPAPVQTSTSIEGMSKDVAYLRRDVDEMKINHEKYHQELMAEIRNQSSSFVNRQEFGDAVKVSDGQEVRIKNLESVTRNTPTVEKLVYGCAALILIAVLSALVYLVVHK